MGMFGRIILVFLILVIGIMVVLPFIFNLAGVNLFQFGGFSGGGFFGGGSKESILLSFGGGEWSTVSFVHDKKTEVPAQVLDFSFHPHDSGAVFLGTRGNGLWKSVDAGHTWAKTMDQARILLPDSDVYKIAVAPSNSNILYAAVYQNNRGRLLKSEDQGNTFREIYFVSADQFGVFDVYVDPRDAGHVFIATGQGGFLETGDGGGTWHVRRWFVEPITGLVVNPRDVSEIYVFTQRGGVLRTVDGGSNWHDVIKGFEDQQKNAQSFGPKRPLSPLPSFSFGNLNTSVTARIFFDPNNFARLYLVRGSELWRSENSGVSWKRIEIIVAPHDGVIGAFVVQRGNSDILFASVSNQLYRSDDGGNNWRIATLPSSGQINRLLIPPGVDAMFAVVAK